MLPTINFNYQSILKADKINYVFSKRLLSAKFYPIQMPIPQIHPELFLGIGLSSPKFPRCVHRLRFLNMSLTPSP